MVLSTLNPAPAWAADNGLINLRRPVPSAGEHDVDRALIAETIHRYGWAYDERREEVLGQCFTENAVFDGSVAGHAEVGPHEGREAILAWLKGFWATQTDQRRHIVLNVLIDDLSADAASVLTYLLVAAAEDGVARIVTTGIYRVSMVKEDGRWLIGHMFAGFDTAF